MSKFISPKTPTFVKNDLNFSNPTNWPIFTDPTFPDLIKICSAVKVEGIFSSYSLIGKPAQVIDFGNLLNLVSGSIRFSLKAAAKVKVLKTDPSSYMPFVALLIRLISFISFLSFGSKSGNETNEMISPLFTSIKIAALPLVLKISLKRINSFLTRYWISVSTLSFIGSFVFFNFSSSDFSNPEIPWLLSSICPIIWLNKFFSG